MASSSRKLEQPSLDLIWSLWAELGVSGWRRSHTSHAIDPELLILFTAFLGDTDARLRDESTDWCMTYGRYISAARLKNLLARQTPAIQAAFGEMAATVNAYSSLRWPGATAPRHFQRTGRSAVVDFRRPSLIVLRLRALFGVGARAEIVRAFVADPPARLTAADLAEEAGYTKRHIAEALDALRMSGLLTAERRRNQLLYRTTDAEALIDLLEGTPASFPRWRAIFRILERLLDLARLPESLTTRARAVEASDVLHDLEVDLRWAGVRMPALDMQVPDPWAELDHWAIELVASWAAGLMGATSQAAAGS